MYNNILIPVAFDEGKTVGAALDVAKALSAKGAQITFLHVFEDIPNFAVSYVPTDYLKEARTAIQAELDNLADGLPNARGLLVEGHASRTIIDVAEREGADCIVVASHRPGMQDFLIGSTAAQVVRHAKCAVHVLR
ncbi:universal stress protein [Pseudoprimorskyibacter insulae]|uniref:Universal stress protein F n=1 Tax=Pseudoprimorskyibacter insulae TaxID=1695997 RepID=A0A2R8AQY6_9RHOB|nr:universal stress protein [Pseudoprimorskyibacter insulae]SPF78249.1 Universal stress protein F [Pseudoprimorskyibacter insulae]